MNRKPICEVHRVFGVLVNGDRVYPHRRDLYSKRFWICPVENCDARCGEHAANGGYMAARETREARMNAHAIFDRLWKDGPDKRFRSRGGAYEWLSKAMGMKQKDCHIGFMNAEKCRQVVNHVIRYLKQSEPHNECQDCKHRNERRRKRKNKMKANPYGHGSNEYYEHEAKANGFASVGEYLSDLKSRTPKCPICGVEYGFNLGIGNCNCDERD